MPRKMLSKILTVLCMLSLMAAAGTALANDTSTQSASLSIIAGTDITMIPPEDFSFTQAFIPEGSSINYAYALLDPTVENETLRVIDADAGSSFSVTLSFSELQGTGDSRHIYPYSKLSFVTLSAADDDDVDGGENNSPAGGHATTAPYNCNWDSEDEDTPDMEDFCLPFMTDFSGGTTATTTLQSSAASSATSLLLNSVSGFRANGMLIVGSDVATYTSYSGNTLNGVYGLETAHSALENVTQYELTSDEYTVLDNATASDIGIYSVGFGLEVESDQNLRPDSYSGTLTFTLIPT